MRLDSSFLTRLYGDNINVPSSEMEKVERDVFRFILMTKSARALQLVYRCIQEWNSVVYDSLNKCLQTFLELIYIPNAKNDKTSILETSMFLTRMAPTSFVCVFNEYVYDNFVRTKVITNFPINRGLIYLHHMREQRNEQITKSGGSKSGSIFHGALSNWWSDTTCPICRDGGPSANAKYSPFNNRRTSRRGGRGVGGGRRGYEYDRNEDDDEGEGPENEDLEGDSDDDDDDDHIEGDIYDPDLGDWGDDDDDDAASANRREYSKCWQIHKAINTATVNVNNYRDILTVLNRVKTRSPNVENYINYVIGKSQKLPEYQRKMFFLNMIAIDMPTANATLPALFNRLRQLEITRIQNEISSVRPTPHRVAMFAPLAKKRPGRGIVGLSGPSSGSSGGYSGRGGKVKTKKRPTGTPAARAAATTTTTTTTTAAATTAKRKTPAAAASSASREGRGGGRGRSRGGRGDARRNKRKFTGTRKEEESDDDDDDEQEQVVGSKKRKGEQKGDSDTDSSEEVEEDNEESSEESD